jgi:hypothetical protein
MLIEAHYYFEKLLKLVKILKASLPLVIAKIYPTILFTSAFDI